MPTSLLFWFGFISFVLIMLALDLGLIHRKGRAQSLRSALLWSAVWIGLALLFNVGIYFGMGPQPALEFLTGYLIEKSLSVDNLFVFLMVFSYFRVSRENQYRVLFWGVMGALVMRALFIAGGIALLEHFHWIIYVFGAFLIFTGIKMSQHKDKQMDPEQKPVVRVARRLVALVSGSRGSPLVLVVMIVELTDVIFAMDSIPAVLAISRNPFIVYTSNIFAILGLRSLYFALAGAMDSFHLIHYALSVILVFVGVKMMVAESYPIPTGLSLLAIGIVLAVAIVASRLWPKKAREPEIGLTERKQLD